MVKNSLKIAIHNRPGSFSDKWIEYCQEHQINYKLVNCFDLDIIHQVEDCDGLMWHWAYWDSKAILFARQLTYSLEHIGKKIFPDSKTCWHYDDKVGQKYLFEAVKAPLIPANIFYNKEKAKVWTKQALFPKVFKLRGGASSVNVKLVRTQRMAFKLINRAFRRGFRAEDRINSLKDRFLILKNKRSIIALVNLFKGFVRLVLPSFNETMRVREKGYVYFQEYIPNNDHDIRVNVIGKRAFAIKRMVRKNDFRASGSGNFIFNEEEIPIECIKSAFFWAEKLKTQSIAFDFLFEKEKLLLTEISYSYVAEVFSQDCPGFWDNNLKWHKGHFIPEWFMIEDFINNLSY